MSLKCNQFADEAGAQIDALAARVAALELLIVELRVAAQGAMDLATPVAGPDITGAFQPITFFDTELYERGVTVDPVTGQFTFNFEGDWVIFYEFSINHATSGSRRTFNVRSFNVTEAIAGTPRALFIGSNQPDTAYTAIVPLSVPAGDVGDIFRIEVGNASSNVTGVTWNVSNLLVMFVGEAGSLVI
ncbi:MAG: hypothetical protein ACR2RF_31350 [Geminicoccaceae bacterium]